MHRPAPPCASHVTFWPRAPPLPSPADLDKLIRAYEKAAGAIAKAGPPRFYVRALVMLEDAVAGVSKADHKDMSSSNARSYTRVKQNVKKHLATERAGFAEAMKGYRANPDAIEATTGGGGGGKGNKGKDVAGGDSSEEEVVIGRECAGAMGLRCASALGVLEVSAFSLLLVRAHADSIGLASRCYNESSRGSTAPP